MDVPGIKDRGKGEATQLLLSVPVSLCEYLESWHGRKVRFRPPDSWTVEHTSGERVAVRPSSGSGMFCCWNCLTCL